MKHHTFMRFAAATFTLVLPAVANAETTSRVASLGESFFVQRNQATGQLELIGSAMIWLLIALSVVCVALISRLWMDCRPVRIFPRAQLERTRKLLRDRQPTQAADELAAGEQTFFAQVTRAALSELSHGHAAMLRAGELAAEEASVHHLRRLEPLNVLGNVAPMIGLFGTVYGIILAFREIVASGGTPDPVGLAAGIGTALVTTFWGLVVAIPALSAYGLLRNTVEGATVEACRAAEQLVNEFRPAAAASAATPTRRPTVTLVHDDTLEAVIQGAR